MADENQSYQYLQLQSKDDKAIWPDALELKLPSEIQAEQLRPIFDRVILAIGAAVSSLGLISMLGFSSLPGLSPWSSPLGILFLGIALSTTLTDHDGDKPAWYHALRCLSLLVPAAIGAYSLLLYLQSVDFSWVRLFSDDFNHLKGASVMGAINLVVAPLCLFLFLTRKHSPKTVLYVISILTLMVFDLGLLPLIGHFNQIPVMYSYKMSFPNSIAFLLSSIAILIGTIPYRGLLLPILSQSPRAKALAYSSFFLGVGISVLGFQALALSLILHQVSDFSAVSTELKQLYIFLAFACAGSCVLVKVLGLRATHHYGGSLFFADLQSEATLNEQIRAKQLENVTELNHLALSDADLPVLFNKCTHLVCETLGLKFAKVLERVPGTKNNLIFRAVHGFNAGLIGNEYDKGNEPHGAYTLEQLEPIVVEDIHHETRFSPSPLHLEYNLVSGVTAVIYGNENKPFGILQVDSQEKRLFTQNDVFFLQAMANILGIALERKRVEQAVIESETRFRLMADAAPNLIWTLNPDGSLSYMNKAGLGLFGVSLERLLHDNWPPYVHPDDLERTSQLLLQVMESKTMFQGEYRVRDVHDNYRWLLSSATPSYLPNGELHGYVGSSVDITDRKQLEETLQESEERFRNMAESAPVNIWLNDAQAHVTYANKSLREFLGRTGEEPFDWERLEYLHPDDVESIKQIYFEAYDQREPFTFEARHRRWDGEYRWIIGNGSPRFSAAGEFMGFIGSSIDITERRQAEEALRESQRQLAESNRDLEHFATIASHDLQAPLRKVRTFMDMVYEGAKGKVDSATLDLVDRSKRSMDKAQTLVQDLLALSKAAKGGRPFQKIELSKVVYRALTNLDQEVREKRAKVIIDSSETLVADEAQLEQLIQNLISNGLKYQPPGQEPEIHIESTCFDPSFCQFSVRDNGIGIPPEQVERIFEPFERLHGKASQYEGTGVGLAICRRIVERHGGSISVEGEPGKGSRFIVRLPYRPSIVEEQEPMINR